MKHSTVKHMMIAQVAARRLRLATVEDALPAQTVEQGLDLLEMMRNIQVFTAGYNYNMNEQVDIIIVV